MRHQPRRVLRLRIYTYVLGKRGTSHVYRKLECNLLGLQLGFQLPGNVYSHDCSIGRCNSSTDWDINCPSVLIVIGGACGNYERSREAGEAEESFSSKAQSGSYHLHWCYCCHCQAGYTDYYFDTNHQTGVVCWWHVSWPTIDKRRGAHH